jgi:hypothetical protein
MTDSAARSRRSSAAIQLSPVLRRGLPVTLLLGLVATCGTHHRPVAIQQVLDRGWSRTASTWSS